jgi:hypothetical protein
VTLKTKATAERIGDIIELTPQILSEPGYDMPTVSKNVFGKKYRYFYAAAMCDPGPFKNSVSSYHTQTFNVLRNCWEQVYDVIMSTWPKYKTF